MRLSNDPFTSGLRFPKFHVRISNPISYCKSKAKPIPKKIKTWECSGNEKKKHRTESLRVTRIRGFTSVEKSALEKKFSLSFFLYHLVFLIHVIVY